MPMRTPAETLAALEAQRDDDDMDSVLAMTPEERARELEAAGFDRAAEGAKADALRTAACAPSSSVTAKIAEIRRPQTSQQDKPWPPPTPKK